ncbi:MAG: GvpL/GvpF family gas vesicle protein, partial [Terriglobales bacterium]
AYCLTEHQALPNGTRARRPFLLEGIQGVSGAPVLSYPSGEFAVIVSEYDRATHVVDEKTVLEHARVVSVCFRNGTVLPFRFGTIFDSDDALRQAVRSNRRAFGVSVEKLRGKSEMRLKLVVRDGSLRDAMINVVLPDTVGREYLAKLREKASKERERQTKARALSVQVHKLFNPLDEEVSCKKVASDGMLIDIAHLIDSKSVEKYQNRYTMAAKQLKNCELVISGPWPPYHFLPGKLRTVAGNS